MTYNIELLGAELLLIGEALDMQPHGRVSALVAKIQQQITAQDAVAAKERDDQIRAAQQEWLQAQKKRRRRG